MTVVSHWRQVGLLLLLLLLLLLASCSPSSVPTVPGPESAALVARVHGHLLRALPRGGIEALVLPDGQRTSVRPSALADASSFATVHSLSGPDDSGRIAYVEDLFFTPDEKDRKHRLRSVRLDGTDDTVVFERSGSAMAATGGAGRGEIGTHLSLAPRGGQVLLLRDVAPRQMSGSLLFEGTLEVWDVAPKTSRPFADGLRAIDAPMAWFPDGRRFVVAILVPGRELAAGTAGLAELGAAERSWDTLPVLHVCELATGHREMLGIGTEAAVAPDGAAVWFGGWVGRARLPWSRIDLASRRIERVDLPGLAGSVVAVVEAELALYVGWPTEGSELRESPLGNRPGGTPMVTIKAADRGTRAFATVVPYLDPRSRVSFGAR